MSAHKLKLTELVDDHDQPDEVMIRLSMAELTGKLVSGMPERDRIVLSLRFGLGVDAEPMTLQEIGAKLNIRPERVRRLVYFALCHLATVLRHEERDIPCADLMAIKQRATHKAYANR